MRIEFYRRPVSEALTWDLQENGESLLGLDVFPEYHACGFFVSAAVLGAPPSPLPLTAAKTGAWLKKAGLAPRFWPGSFWPGGGAETLLRFAEAHPETHARGLKRWASTPAHPAVRAYAAACRADRPHHTTSRIVGTPGEIPEDLDA